MCPFLHLLELFEKKPGGRGVGVLAPLALHRVVAAWCLLLVAGAVPVPVELLKFLLFFFLAGRAGLCVRGASGFYFCLSAECSAVQLQEGVRKHPQRCSCLWKFSVHLLRTFQVKFS